MQMSESGVMMQGSCFFKVLRIDLNKRQTLCEDIPEQRLRAFLGGVGFGTEVLFREGIDAEPFEPENPLIFASGPLNGTRAPGSGSYCVVTRSPLTGGLTSAQANGFFGRCLKSCGYDALVITGQASDLVYIRLTDDTVEFKDATHLRGKDTWETENQLREVYGRSDHRVSIACIGPAGEKLVRFAIISNDLGHVAASGGVGAVMGAKNVKALVVGGAAKVKIFDAGLFEASIRKWRESAITSSAGQGYHTAGTAGDFVSRVALGSLPIRNLTSDSFPEHAKFSGAKLRNEYQTNRRACYGCNIAHLHTFAIKGGPYNGFVGEEAEYEDLAAWGSNLGISNPEATIWLNNLADRMGIDAKEGTFTVGLAIECFNRGILTEKETEGLHLSWDNPNLIAQLLRKIAYREGLGELLAEGVVRTARAIGKEAQDLAVYLTKGCAPHVHDIRNVWEVLFSQVISNTPSFESIHLYGTPEPEFGINVAPDDFNGPDIARAVAIMTTKRQITDSLVVCNFLCRGSFATVIEAVSAATGWNLSFEEMATIGRRITTLSRLYNYKEGFSIVNDDISLRMATPPQGGIGKGLSIKPALAEMRRIYYREMGWDPETGTPLPETVQALGL